MTLDQTMTVDMDAGDPFAFNRPASGEPTVRITFKDEDPHKTRCEQEGISRQTLAVQTTDFLKGDGDVSVREPSDMSGIDPPAMSRHNARRAEEIHRSIKEETKEVAPRMAGERGDGEENKGEVAYRRRLPLFEQSVPKGQLSVAGN